MKLNEAAQWAEVVSAIAIVVSLIYVGMQLTDNTSATRSDTASHASSEFANWYALVAADEELVDVFLTGIKQPEELTEVERLRFILLVHFLLVQFQNKFYMVEQGTLDGDVLDSITSTLTTIKGTPGWEMYWGLRRNLFLEEFVQFIEGRMYESDYETSEIYLDPVMR